MMDVIVNDSGEIDSQESSMEAQSQKLTSDPRAVDVDVYLDSIGPPVQFRIDSHLQAPEGGHLDFNNKGHDGFMVHFHLQDLTGGNYTFPGTKDLRDAVWSQLGDACPKSGVWDVFEPKKVKNDGRTLVAYNPNPCPAQGPFQYALNVTNGGPFVSLDPGGNNGNGSN